MQAWAKSLVVIFGGWWVRGEASFSASQKFMSFAKI
jgi:hypothetical protein